MIYGYPQPGKAKSERLLVDFMAGAGGYIERRLELRPEAAAFCGVVGIERLFGDARRRAEQDAGDFYYIDNAFLDCARERYFRIARNAIQAAPRPPAFDRLRELGVEVKPWRSSGGHIVVVEQSDHFLRNVGGYPAGGAHWLEAVERQLRQWTDRPLRIRRWQRNKLEASATLGHDLAGAWALVTHMSAAANEALLAGIPAFVTGRCVASELALANLAEIESPRMPEGREDWAARLAAAQWRPDEMRSGRAWSELGA